MAFNEDNVTEQMCIEIAKQAGLIVRVGSNKTGYWKVTIDNL